jgi:hypothetical protein
VYSLGATLLYAATGHAPYHGDTVMDVLVKLATEPPDLTGLPPDLAALINACLAHSPRDRPTSAKLLAGLGSFVEGSTAAADGHTYLPDSAMALIAGYQRSPQTGSIDTANDDPTSDEPTSASHTALRSQEPRPGPRHGASSGLSSRRAARTGGPAPGSTGSGPSQPVREWEPDGHRREAGSGNHRARIGLIAAGCVAGAAVLIAGGAYLGPKVDPGLVSGTGSDPSSVAAPIGPPPSTLPTGTSTTPKLVLNQPTGDPVTGFVIHGMGFVPDTRVNVALVGHGTSAWHPEVDPMGTFNYVFDQDHLFFRRGMPIGSYQVVVTGSGGRRATAKFRVDPAPVPRPPGPAPTGQPPAGAPPTGQPPTGTPPTGVPPAG